MQPEIHQGYTVYKKNYGPVWVALHSGPAVSTTSRDDNADGIASLCWEKTGGTLILSNVTRDMTLGIDFNRDLPNIETAMGSYQKFNNGEFNEEKKRYKGEYAFVAGTKKSYIEKMKIYKSLWEYIRNSGDFLIFMHRQFARIKNYPSAIDIITFNDCGIKKEIIRKIIDDTNHNHEDFFKRIEKSFKNVTYVEQMKKLILYGLKSSTIASDVKIMKQFCGLEEREALEREINEINFMAACGSALKSMPFPEITMERVFSAELAIGPKKEIIKNRNKIAMEIEINAFMSEWYPKETSRIIIEIADKVKKVDEYKKMGFNQTQILKFIS